MNLYTVMDNHDNSFTGITVRAEDADKALDVFLASPYFNEDVNYTYANPREAYSAEKAQIIDADNPSLVG